jgi:hypothetical protein
MSSNMEGNDAVQLLSHVPLVARIESEPQAASPPSSCCFFGGGDATDDQPNI